MKHPNYSDNFIYGAHSVEELMNDESKIKKIEKIYVDESKHKQYHSLLNKARLNKISVQYVPAVKLDKLVKNKKHQGIVVHLLDIEYYTISDILNRTTKKIELIVFLDRITDVRNFGSIARSAYALGADALLIPSKDSASINADAIKTSAGALIKIPVCKEPNILDTLQLLKNKGFQIIACHEKTSSTIDEINFTHPSVIILGSEHNGILKEYLKVCDAEAKIPMNRVFDSLNVAVSAGIVLYEVTRQKRKNKK
ncbi:MAG: 23S rRNA (guanosine(2251)-2'-O)-methyltransferase RlmB [Bacteroidia bacterium]|nr:23S rRNA (guanosine(2251)-2'-O)-methyltransferase RlmB [Bacteroidia bacterium]